MDTTRSSTSLTRAFGVHERYGPRRDRDYRLPAAMFAKRVIPVICFS